MTLTALLRQLERLEQGGYSGCEVELFPEMAPDEGLATYVLDFASLAYRVCAVRLPGAPSEGVVMLHFAAVETQ